MTATGVPSWARGESWTNGQMLMACLENVREAAQEEGRLRALMNSLPPGDARLVGDKTHPPLGLQVRRAAADLRHWRGEVAYWRARCLEEGDNARPPAKWTPPKVQRPAAPSYIDDPKLDGDPIVEEQRRQRREAETQREQLERLARQAAAEGRGDIGEQGELPF